MLIRIVQKLICFGGLGLIAAVAIAWTLALYSPVDYPGTLDGGDRATLRRLGTSGDIQWYPKIARFVWQGGGFKVTIFCLGGGGYYHMLFEVGWPLTCFEADTKLLDRQLRPSLAVGKGQFDVGVRLQVDRVIPLRPRVVGLCVNSLFFGAGFWVLFTCGGVVRRRMRLLKGRCRGCGYDLTHANHEVCPECGAER